MESNENKLNWSIYNIGTNTNLPSIEGNIIN